MAAAIEAEMAEGRICQLRETVELSLEQALNYTMSQVQSYRLLVLFHHANTVTNHS